MSSFEIGDLVRLKGDERAELLQVMLVEPTAGKPIKCLPHVQLHQGSRGFLSFTDHKPEELEHAAFPFRL